MLSRMRVEPVLTLARAHILLRRLGQSREIGVVDQFQFDVAAVGEKYLLEKSPLLVRRDE